MNAAQHAAIANFIWGIADDVLRDVSVRGKYRDMVLPMTVVHRLDVVSRGASSSRRGWGEA